MNGCVEIKITEDIIKLPFECELDIKYSYSGRLIF